MVDVNLLLFDKILLFQESNRCGLARDNGVNPGVERWSGGTRIRPE